MPTYNMKVFWRINAVLIRLLAINQGQYIANGLGNQTQGN